MRAAAWILYSLAFPSLAGDRQPDVLVFDPNYLWIEARLKELDRNKPISLEEMCRKLKVRQSKLYWSGTNLGVREMYYTIKDTTVHISISLDDRDESLRSLMVWDDLAEGSVLAWGQR